MINLRKKHDMRRVVIMLGLVGMGFAGMAENPIGLRNDQLRIEFTAPDQALGLLRIENVNAGYDFFRAASESPRLWRVDLTLPGNDQTVLQLDNRSARRARVMEQTSDLLHLRWDGIDAGDVRDALAVDLTVTLDDDGVSVWSITPVLSTEAYTFGALVFPCVEQVIDPEREKILFPAGNNGSRLIAAPLAATYPSFASQLEFFGFFGDRPNAGLYMGIHDGEASIKRFELDDKMQLSVLNYAMDISVPGKSRCPAYPVVIAPSTTPWDCCAQYRDWATQQRWTQRGKRSERTDMLPGTEDIALWLNVDEIPSVTVPVVLQEAEEHKLPVVLHWYYWSVHEGDQKYPEFFPPREGFKEGVARMVEAGVFVVPYLNGRLWDTALPSFDSVRSELSTRVDGSALIEDYGSGTTLGAMCASSPSFGQKIREAIATLADEYGLNGVYLDQVASVEPTMCYNATHGHPLGGGGWWQEAYREMLAPTVKKYSQNLLFLTENGAEPYIDTFDTFLLWCQVYTDDFPSLIAVYNQYAWYMCQLALPEDEVPAFVALMSRCLLWNIQPGWLAWLHCDSLDRIADAGFKRDYVKRIMWLHQAGNAVLENGLPVGDVVLNGTGAKVTTGFQRSTNYGRMPVAMGEIPAQYGVYWRSEDDSMLLAAIAEISGAAKTVSFVMQPELWGVDATGKSVWRLLEDGSRQRVGAPGEEIAIALEPYDLQLYLLAE